MAKCARRRCGKRFTPVRQGQRYCSTACRVKDWRNRRRRAPTALSKAFDLLAVDVQANDVAVIVEKVALQWLERWLSAWVGFTWSGQDFIDSLAIGG